MRPDNQAQNHQPKIPQQPLSPNNQTLNQPQAQTHPDQVLIATNQQSRTEASLSPPSTNYSSKNKNRLMRWVAAIFVVLLIIGFSVFYYLQREASAEDLRQAILGDGAVTCNFVDESFSDILYVRDGDILEVGSVGTGSEINVLKIDREVVYRWNKDAEFGSKSEATSRDLRIFERAENQEQFVESINEQIAEDENSISCTKGASRSLFVPPNDIDFNGSPSSIDELSEDEPYDNSTLGSTTEAYSIIFSIEGCVRSERAISSCDSLEKIYEHLNIDQFEFESLSTIQFNASEFPTDERTANVAFGYRCSTGEDLQDTIVSGPDNYAVVLLRNEGVNICLESKELV